MDVLNGQGYIFSCTVIIFQPQDCARSLSSGLIVRMSELLFSPPAFELFFRAMALRISS